MNSYTDLDGIPTAADARAAHRAAARRRGASTAPSSPTTSRSRSSSSCTATARTGPTAAARRARRRHRRRAAHREDLRRSPACAPSTTARSTRRSSTGRCGACCGRRPSSGCSTPTGRRCRPRSRRSISTTSGDDVRGTVDLDSAGEPRPRPPSSPKRRSCSLRNDGVLPLAAPGRDRGDRPERATTPTPCSAATRSRRTSACSIPRCRLGIALPDAARGARGGVPGRRDPLRARAPRRRRRDRRHSPRRLAAASEPTSSCSRSATVPACSAAARAARAATPSRSTLPGAQQALARRRARDRHPDGR